MVTNYGRFYGTKSVGYEDDLSTRSHHFLFF
jgi:hypothetical protein